MHFYPFNISDYRASTAHLSNEEDLAYRRLIDMYYDTEKPIPLETHWVAKRIRVDAHIVDLVLEDMFERTDDGWFHDRCSQEIEKYQSLVTRNTANGRKGGRPAGNPVGSQSKPTGKLTKNQELRTKNQEPIKDKALPRPESVSEQVWKDFVSQRKRIKADITETALKGIALEAVKAGWTLEAALTECTVRGWRGFKADWVTQPGRQPKDFDNINYGEGVQEI
jgi:uncharacterized protein YdaU (DUF1376 family)